MVMNRSPDEGGSRWLCVLAGRGCQRWRVSTRSIPCSHHRIGRRPESASASPLGHGPAASLGQEQDFLDLLLGVPNPTNHVGNYATPLARLQQRHTSGGRGCGALKRDPRCDPSCATFGVTLAMRVNVRRTLDGSNGVSSSLVNISPWSFIRDPRLRDAPTPGGHATAARCAHRVGARA